METGTSIAFDAAPIGLLISRDRVIEACNRACGDVFGYPPAALAGRSLALLYPSRDEFRRIGEIGLERMRKSGVYLGERIMRRRNAELFWCRVRGQSLTPEAPFAHAVWSMEDISDSRPIVQLSRRERQVAMLLTEGHTSKEIARLLGISHRTVEAHRSSLNRKLNVRNSAECVARLSGLPD
ncbi:helix-turn-helix transcriptional regulator [Roseivivax sp. CAU 1753]